MVKTGFLFGLATCLALVRLGVDEYPRSRNGTTHIFVSLVYTFSLDDEDWSVSLLTTRFSPHGVAFEKK
jgi:hypothetical protein